MHDSPREVIQQVRDRINYWEWDAYEARICLRLLCDVLEKLMEKTNE